jgi:hypothetical protein
MPVRDVEFYICQELEFQEWLLTPEAKCVAHNYLEEKYQEKWNAERKELPERSLSSLLRKVFDKSAESALESFCDVQMRLVNNFMC